MIFANLRTTLLIDVRQQTMLQTGYVDDFEAHTFYPFPNFTAEYTSNGHISLLQSTDSFGKYGGLS